MRDAGALLSTVIQNATVESVGPLIVGSKSAILQRYGTKTAVCIPLVVPHLGSIIRQARFHVCVLLFERC